MAMKPGQQLFEALQRQPNLHLQIGDRIVDVGALRISTPVGTTRIAAKDMALLIELVRHRGEAISRARLLLRVWGEDRESHDISVRVAIVKLRKALCDSRKESRYIETVPCVGYRLIAPVTFLPAEAECSPRLSWISKHRSPRSTVDIGPAAEAGA